MTELTLQDVQRLLDDTRGGEAIVSCYADRTLAVGFQSLWAQRFKNEAARINQRLAEDPHARLRFGRDVEVIQRELESAAAQHTGGMAIFSDVDRGFFRAFVVSEPVTDRLVLDRAPYVVPLLEAMHRQRRYLVVLTDMHRSRVYDSGGDRAHLIAEVAADVSSRRKSASELGARQATETRHRDDQILHYRKTLLREIEKAWPAAPFRGLILLGDHAAIEELRAMLPPSLAARVSHAAPHHWEGEQLTIDAEVQATVDEAVRAHDTRLMEELGRRLRENYLVVAGPQEVVNAMRSSQVDHPGCLVLEPDRGDVADRCQACGSIFVTPHATCSYCQGTCEKVNLWQEILLSAARHNIAAHTVAAHPELSRHGGIAALLSRQEPWEPAGVAASGRARRQ